METPLSGNSRTHRFARGSTVTLTGLFVACFLVGCAPDAPEFVPPMMWDADESYGPDGLVRDHVVVELRDDETARLTGFPIGQSIETDDGTYCIDGFTDKRFTGTATWEARNQFSFWLTFDDSRILVSGDAQFGEEDWSTIGFDACGGSRSWDFAYVCGDSGYGDEDNTTAFRDECPSAE